jgi:hypothetical protein
MGPAFELETPFTFDSDMSATRDWYVTNNVSNENLTSFLVVVSCLYL